MKKVFIISILSFILLVGCDKEENNNVSTTENSTNITTLKTTSTTTEAKETTTTEKFTTTTSCKHKKFKHSYTYTYKTKNECNEQGNNDFYDVYDNVNSKVDFYGCEEIVDDCGDTYWGVYFRIWTGPGNDDYEKWYY